MHEIPYNVCVKYASVAISVNLVCFVCILFFFEFTVVTLTEMPL